MMHKYNDLLSKIFKEMNIRKGSTESENNWKARIVYSAIGQMALASLHDVQEDSDDGQVSITHFKRRIENLYDSYLSMYPELKSFFMIEADELSQNIYDIFLNAGCIYHSPNRITASIYQVVESGQVLFIRGSALNQRVFRSGLGAYLPSRNISSSINVAKMFGLQEVTLLDYWKSVVSKISWSESRFTAKVEYLRTESPFNEKYFKDYPDKDGRISLLRTGMPGSYIYFFYKFCDDTLLNMQVPSWLTDNYGYRLLSNSCLHFLGCLPPATYQVYQDIVLLRLGYLYPPAELNLIRLYSWPERFNKSPFDQFAYILALPVFISIKGELERLGYKFVEK